MLATSYDDLKLSKIESRNIKLILTTGLHNPFTPILHFSVSCSDAFFYGLELTSHLKTTKNPSSPKLIQLNMR